ncbi:MAG: cytochrome o ubiquinol oxidase subunit IV [Candidatus Saccharimonadales bacterium]
MKPIKLKPQYSYIFGYVLALILTLNAYVAATLHVGAMTSGLMNLLIALAVVQLLVQVVYFLHLGHEARPRWNTMAFIVTAMVLLFIVIGSIWVMHNLDYNMMTPDMQQTMINDEGLHHQ